MNALHSLVESMTALTPLEKLGWVLLQSLWQQALIAVIPWLALMLLRGRSAHTRYIFACAALTVMALLPAATAALALPPRHAHTDSFVPVAHEFALPASNSAPTFARPEKSAFAWISLYRCASWAWIVGVCWFSLWNLLGWLKVHRLCRSARPAPVPCQEKLAELAEKIGATCRTSIGISQGIAAPSVIGWLRPLVLVPASALSELPATYLEALLLHELAHIRRHDYLINLFQIAIETLFFYHPAVWWVSSRIRAERENCCDDIAVSHCGSADLYVRALAAMEEIRLGPITTFAMASTGGSLLKRIERLIGRSSSREKRRHSPLVGAAGLALLATIVLAPHPAVTHAVASPTTTAPAPATDPNTMDTVHPEDLEPPKAVDYRICPNDLLAISIADLNGPNTETLQQRRVNRAASFPCRIWRPRFM